MGNNKISITAELVSIIKAKEDPKNLYFVSPKAKRIYNLAKKIISEKNLQEIFDWRLKLSEKFDEKIAVERPKQIIELAAGYSLRGFNFCMENKDLIYIDSDFADVISQKREILKTICEKENIGFPNNYFLVALDVLEDNIFDKIKNLVSRDKKILVMAEGLTSYFTDSEFQKFIENIKTFLTNFSDGEFYSHENIFQSKGILYRLFRALFVSTATRTKGRRGFKTVKEFEDYLENENIAKFKTYSDKSDFLLYSIFSS